MRIKNVLKKLQLHFFIAVHAFFVLYLCYVAGNIPYSLGSEVQTVKWLNALSGWLSDKKELLPDELLPINVSYDKELTKLSNEYGMPLGVIDITDRTKLYKLLSIIDSVGNYKYVVCDLFFSSEYQTNIDSTLYNLISRMPRFVIAGGESPDELPESIRNRAFSAGYNITIDESSFVKYPLISNDKESIALQMWKEMYGGTLGGNSLLSTSNGRLCRRTMFLQLPIQIPDGSPQYLNMGADIIDVKELIDMQTLFKDKIILIGSFVEDDIHSTVVGDMPGVMINYNAFYALREGQHYISVLSAIILFVIFYLVTFVVTSHKSVFDQIPEKFRPKSIIMRLLYSVISLSTIFSLLFLFFYIFFEETYDIFFIASYFSLLFMTKDIYMNYINLNSSVK